MGKTWPNSGQIGRTRPHCGLSRPALSYPGQSRPKSCSARSKSPRFRRIRAMPGLNRARFQLMQGRANIRNIYFKCQLSEGVRCPSGALSKGRLANSSAHRRCLQSHRQATGAMRRPRLTCDAVPLPLKPRNHFTLAAAVLGTDAKVTTLFLKVFVRVPSSFRSAAADEPSPWRRKAS